ncbi:MAG: hypothetical protein ACR2KX_02905 [Chitinophagaceae bacterium]
MKKILFICLSFCIILSKTNAQMRDTTISNHKVDAAMFFQKSKKQKTAAWTLLGGGAGLSALGLVLYAAEKGKNPSAELDILPKGTLPSAIGQSMMVASIPFFISAAKNKRKANFIFKDETVFFNLQAKKHLVSVGIKIK